MLTSNPTFARSPARKTLPAIDAAAAEAGIEVGQRYTADDSVLGVRKGDVVVVAAIVGEGEDSEFGKPVTWEAVCYRSEDGSGRMSAYYFLYDFTRVQD
jgi:hypothetical protein